MHRMLLWLTAMLVLGSLSFGSVERLRGNTPVPPAALASTAGEFKPVSQPAPPAGSLPPSALAYYVAAGSRIVAPELVSGMELTMVVSPRPSGIANTIPGGLTSMPGFTGTLYWSSNESGA
jgi:hypothetical protein